MVAQKGEEKIREKSSIRCLFSEFVELVGYPQLTIKTISYVIILFVYSNSHECDRITEYEGSRFVRGRLKKPRASTPMGFCAVQSLGQQFAEHLPD